MATNAEVAAAFAELRSERAANMYSHGNEVFSYGSHYMIAGRRNTEDGPVVLVNETRVSATTSRHTGLVRRALTDAGYEPTDETEKIEGLYRGMGHGAPTYTFRIWKRAA